MANYINALIAAASEQLKTKPKGIGFSGQIFCLVKPERKAKYWLMSKTPERLESYETALLSALKTVTVPDIIDGPLALALQFDAWEGGPDFMDTPMIIPDAWLSALPKGGGYMDDTVLLKIFPD